MNQRIQRFAKLFRAIFLAILVLTPVVVAGLWLSGGDIMLGDRGWSTIIGLATNDVNLDAAHAPSFPLAWDQRWLGLAVDLIPLGVTMLCLWWACALVQPVFSGRNFYRQHRQVYPPNGLDHAGRRCSDAVSRSPANHGADDA